MELVGANAYRTALWDAIRDPEAGYFRRELTYATRFLLLIVAEAANSDGNLPLTTFDLLALTGMSDSTLDSAVQTLKSLGIVSTEIVNGGRSIKLHDPADWAPSDNTYRDEVLGRVAKRFTAKETSYSTSRRDGAGPQQRPTERTGAGAIIARRPPLTVAEVFNAVTAIDTKRELLTWFVANADRIPGDEPNGEAEDMTPEVADAIAELTDEDMGVPRRSTKPRTPQEHVFDVRMAQVTGLGLHDGEREGHPIKELARSYVLSGWPQNEALRKQLSSLQNNPAFLEWVDWFEWVYQPQAVAKTVEPENSIVHRWLQGGVEITTLAHDRMSTTELLENLKAYALATTGSTDEIPQTSAKLSRVLREIGEVNGRKLIKQKSGRMLWNLRSVGAVSVGVAA
ncbi:MULTISPECIES: hypothetical protein [unclassified Luteococcus]|uniref:hypothetical protein n=1 Tax=unclassified Luteococcus TaxID=2639923 RepID=UPI00313C2A1A